MQPPPARRKNSSRNRFTCGSTAEGNYATLSHPDSIRYYVSKIHDMGFTDVVVDVKSIMGETLYKSDIAPYMGEWTA